MKKKLRQNMLMGNGETYTLGVAIVGSKRPDGTPHRLQLLGMDETVDLVALREATGRDPEFVTVYLPKHVVKSGLCIPGDTGGKDTGY